MKILAHFLRFQYQLEYCISPLSNIYRTISKFNTISVFKRNRASITTPATRQPIHPHTHQRTHQTTDLYIQVHASNEHSKQKRVPKHETMPVQNWNPTSGSVSVPVQPASDDRLRQTANFWRRHFSTESMSGVESFRALTPAV